MKHHIIFYIGAALLSLTGCMQLEMSDLEDAVINFGVTTEYDNGPETRTEYSGQIYGSTTKYERINWIAGSDKIRVICNEVAGSPTALDYNINTVASSSNKNSSATVTSASGESFTWNGTVAHYFYALYPSPNQDGAPSGVSIESNTGHTAKVHGSVPATQPGKEWVASTRTYKPDMNYAYMYAAKQQSNTNPPATTNVTLEFKPLVTAIQFSLLGDSNYPISADLTKAELISSSTYLAGDFDASLNASGLVDIPPVSNGSMTLTINFPAGIKLSTSAVTTFTFLALPVQQKNLTLKLYFGSTTRSIELTDVTVAACKKAYFSNVNVPGKAQFTFTVGNPPVDAIINSDGGSENWTVKSFYTCDGVQKPAAWKAVEYYTSTDGGMTWTPSKSGNNWVKPSWFPTIPNDPGSTTDKRYTTTLGVNNQTTTKSWTGPKTPDGNAGETQATDLSKVNFLTGQAIAETTANCYVVTGPGWYKFPLVYGNARKNGGDNSGAYSNSNGNSNVLKNFIRHDGRPITSPKIRDNVTVAGTLLCWQDFSADFDVIDDVKFSKGSGSNHDYIYFHVTTDNNKIRQGNALIAATSGSNGTGDIVWSWHIWIIERDRLTTIPMRNCHDMLNVNLGWYDANATILQRAVKVVLEQTDSKLRDELVIKQDVADVFGGCVFYQWGRKDPIVGFNENYEVKQTRGSKGFDKHKIDSHTEEYTTRHGLITYTRKRTIIDTPLEYTIKHPNEFIYLTGDKVPNGHKDQVFVPQIESPLSYVAQGRWCNGRYENLWNAQAAFATDNEVVKTVYDPCPAGFKIPRYNAFNSLGEGVKSLGFGFLYKTTTTATDRMLFPVTSMREDSGTLRSKTHPDFKQCYIWTAGKHQYNNQGNTAPSNSCGSYLQIKSLNDYNPKNTMGLDAMGFCVRPEKE